jgi:hypothetical protein
MHHEDALPGFVDVGEREAACARWLVFAVRGFLVGQTTAELAVRCPVQVVSISKAFP